MDIFSFINSVDIRDYLKGIGYSFTTLETAWLIWQCRKMSLDEKHAAWKEIMDTMPDCRVVHRRKERSFDSLFSSVERYLVWQSQLIRAFYTPDPDWVYQYEDSPGWLEKAVFRTYDKCLAALKKERAAADPARSRSIYKIRLDTGGDSTGREYVCAEISGKGLMNLYHFSGMPDKDPCPDLIFDGMGFSFPLPFKRGDIVWIPSERHGPLVLDRIGLKGAAYEKRNEEVLGHGDYTDMNILGYYADSEWGITYDVAWNYMDCEYYQEELDGYSRILIPLSNYLKGEIGLDLLIQAAHWMLLNENADRGFPCGFPKEKFLLAGLECQ